MYHVYVLTGISATPTVTSTNPEPTPYRIPLTYTMHLPRHRLEGGAAPSTIGRSTVNLSLVKNLGLVLRSDLGDAY